MSQPSTDLATPMIITADMTPAEFAVEFAKMQLRAAATADFLDGEIGADDWLDVLDECGIDVGTAVRDWTNGISYLA
jgi:hypothetical protein